MPCVSTGYHALTCTYVEEWKKIDQTWDLGTFFYVFGGNGGFHAVCGYGSFRGPFHVFVLVPELAEISFGHEELSVVVLAVKLALMRSTV